MLTPFERIRIGVLACELAGVREYARNMRSSLPRLPSLGYEMQQNLEISQPRRRV